MHTSSQVSSWPWHSIIPMSCLRPLVEGLLLNGFGCEPWTFPLCSQQTETVASPPPPLCLPVFVLRFGPQFLPGLPFAFVLHHVLPHGLGLLRVHHVIVQQEATGV